MFVLAGAMFACAKDPSADAGVAVPEAVESSAGIVAGWVRIRLSDDSATLREGVFTRGEAETGNEAVDLAAARLGATEVRRVFPDGGRFEPRHRRYGLHLWYDLRIDGDVPVTRAVADIAGLPGIEYVGPIHTVVPADDARYVPAEAVYTPSSSAVAEEGMPFDDPLLPKQWHYHNVGATSGFAAGADINLFEAWKRETGDPGVIVAVMDGGIQVDHPDLARNMWVNEAELNGEPGKDNDGNGLVGDIYGWNFLRDMGEIVPHPHGTHVAGTVAAVNNNGLGVCGVAGGNGDPDTGARLMSCQMYEVGEAGASNEAKARMYVYAADMGAVISQNSWTFSSSVSVLPSELSVAFDYFIENAGMSDTDGDGVNDVQTGPMAGGILIFAGGNEGTPSLRLPASDPRVVAVVGMGPDYGKPQYSNYGERADIYAPGGNIFLAEEGGVYSTSLDGGYAYDQGTSMATPHVSGAAALIVSHYGGEGFTAQECRDILLRSTRNVYGRLNSEYFGKLGRGLLDAGLIFLEDPGKAPGAPADGSVQPIGNRIRMRWTAPADANGMSVASFRIVYDGACTGIFEGKVEDVSGDILALNYSDAGDSFIYDFAARYNTDYRFAVSAVDRFGNESAPIALEASVGEYENVGPKLMRRFPMVEMAGAGEEHAVSFLLTDYFTDDNVAEGDVLDYSVTVDDPRLLSAVIAGEELKLMPLAKGAGKFVVTVTDLSGAFARSTVKFVVLDGPDPDVSSAGGMTLTERVADTLDIVAAGGDTGQVEIVIHDAAARRVFSGSIDMVDGAARVSGLGHLAPGVYSVSVALPGGTVRGRFLKL